MNNIKHIIIEEVIKFLKESDDSDYDYWENFSEQRENMIISLFNDFLFNNNETFSKHINWKVAPSNRIKKIWEDYMTYGVVRDERGVDLISDIILENIMKIYIITVLAGHTSEHPDEYYNDNIGYNVDEYLNGQLNNPNLDKFIGEFIANNVEDEDRNNHNELKTLIAEELKDKFLEYYIEDPKSGHAYLTDYGLDALLNYYHELRKTSDYEDKIPILDKILNVVHQRSDLALWFIEGGSSALSNISGYESGEFVGNNTYSSNVNNLEKPKNTY